MDGRVVLSMLCLIACKRATDETRVAPTPRPTVAPRDAISTDAAPIDAAVAVDVELLHAVPATIAVSSVVANAAIRPAMIADGDTTTAWNSRTRDFRAWVAFRVPADAHVTSIRMTVGFTATGSEGDYFTMNQRITRVRITHLGEPGDLGTHDLDVDDRGLQTIPINGPGGDYRIQIIEWHKGTEWSWREVAISELEVWGTAAGATPNSRDPTITIGSLGAAPVVDVDSELVPLERASIPAFCAANATRRITTTTDPIPACGQASDGPALALPTGWTYSYFLTPWGDRDGECNLAIVRGGSTYILDGYADSACGNANRWTAGMCETRRLTIVDGQRVAIISARNILPPTDFIGIFPDHVVEHARVCGVSGGAVACSESIQVGDISCTAYGEGLPGADGLAIDQTGWTKSVTFTRGRLRVGGAEDAGEKQTR